MRYGWDDREGAANSERFFQQRTHLVLARDSESFTMPTTAVWQGGGGSFGFRSSPVSVMDMDDIRADVKSGAPIHKTE